MPIKSGRYFIINVQTKNQAFLRNSDSWEPIQSRYRQDDPGEQWNIIDRKNGHHGIVNVRHPTQYAASDNRAAAGAQVVGWERDHTWLIQKTEVKGQYTISTTDSKRFWGLTDVQQGTPIALADVYTDPRNWWMFKDVETANDAEVEPTLDNGRTAYDTATGELAVRAVLFELALPPISPSKPLELDLFVLQEMPNEFVQNATETADKICRPLIKSGQLSPSNLVIDVIEFETFEKVSRRRFFGQQTFDSMRNLRSVDFPWVRCADYVIPSSLKKRDFRSSATKVIVMNLRSIPLRNGGKVLWELITQMADENVILILTLSTPHVPDTLFDTDFFRELARLSSGSILSLPEDRGRFYSCIVDYLENFDVDSIKTKFPDVVTIKPEIPLRQRKHLTLDNFIETGYARADNADEEYDDRIDSDDDLVDDDDVEEVNGDSEDEDDIHPPPGTYNPGGGNMYGPNVPMPTW